MTPRNMSKSPLDRPVWHALSTRLRKFAIGNDLALRMLPEFGPFAAARDDSEDSLLALAELVRSHGPVAMMQAGTIATPPGTTVRMEYPCVQMVARSVVPVELATPVEALSPAHAEQMLDLAQRTEPGPFMLRTPELGPFLGIRDANALVAMAGERLSFEGFTEVSGVCTDASQRGKGYAGLLSRAVASQIMKRGDTPFLHALTTNTTAISLYKTLGFEIRTTTTAVLLVAS
jgi:predicted GNAT family acetyltransferase